MVIPALRKLGFAAETRATLTPNRRDCRAECPSSKPQEVTEESVTYTDLARGDLEGKWDFSHSFRREKLNIDKAEWMLKSHPGSRT